MLARHQDSGNGRCVSERRPAPRPGFVVLYLGYLLTFGVHDHTILPRALIAVVALPVLLLVALPRFWATIQWHDRCVPCSRGG